MSELTPDPSGAGSRVGAWGEQREILLASLISGSPE
jgi:hypothetical protein